MEAEHGLSQAAAWLEFLEALRLLRQHVHLPVPGNSKSELAMPEVLLISSCISKLQASCSNVVGRRSFWLGPCAVENQIFKQDMTLRDPIAWL